MLNILKIGEIVEKRFKAMDTGQFFLVGKQLHQKVYDNKGCYMAIQIEDGILNEGVVLDHEAKYPIVNIDVTAMHIEEI